MSSAKNRSEIKVTPRTVVVFYYEDNPDDGNYEVSGPERDEVEDTLSRPLRMYMPHLGRTGYLPNGFEWIKKKLRIKFPQLEVVNPPEYGPPPKLPPGAKF